MNDRVSAAPPADFLDEGSSTADYERQFAMDWKPPELKFGNGNGNNVGGDNGYNNVAGNRNSFMSVHSGLSSFTTRPGTGGLASSTTTATNKSSRGLFGKVREKLTMHKSRSNWTIGGAGESDDQDADNNSSWANFPIPPVFKHKRSESMDPSTLRANNRTGGSNESSSTINHSANDFGAFQRNAAAAAASRPAPPARADSLVTTLPSFDPTKRPTRDEINANYQSLLASGFFGTHAIQSTRFSPPGANAANRQSEAHSEAPSLAQKMEEDHEDDNEQQAEGTFSQTGSNFPPSPERLPPPPPPPNREPPLPPPDMAMDVEDEVSASIPASSTAVFSPLPPPRTSSREGNTTMSPPPLPKQRQSKKQPALAFSSVPYASTSAGAEPKLTARPFRPPPVSLARFSVDSSRPRSIDMQPPSFAVRGTKRPFSSAGTNGSQTSFYTHRSSYDYDPMATDGHGGIGVATTTAAEDKVESGPRKLVKRLRRSASKLSFRNNTSTTKMGGVGQGNDEGEDGGELQQPATRTSISSTVRRSFSWRLGSSKPPETFSDPQKPPSSSTTNNNIFGNGCDNFSRNTSMDHFEPPPPPAPTFAPPSPPHQGLPTIAASPSSADRNRLKKREIRSRRLRRKEESHTPTKGFFSQQQQQQQQQQQDAMDWQHPPSPSKRPRRSDASIFLRALDSAPTIAAVEDDSSDSEPEMPAPIAAGHHHQPTQEQSQSPPPGDGMEGVEFSFHFPGRTRPAAAATGGVNGVHLGGPLAVVPDVNRGMPTVATNSFSGFGSKKMGSVRVVRGDVV